MLNLNKKKDALELLNYEGPVLMLHKLEENKYSLLNQWNEEVREMTREDVLSFVMGDLLVTCPRQKKVWNFTVQHKEARVRAKDLERFLF